MFFKNILFDLEMRETSIEEAAELKKVTIETVKANLRRLGYSIVDFRMWEDVKKEKKRLIWLFRTDKISKIDFDTRSYWLNEGGTTEEKPIMGDLFDINDITSCVVYKQMGTRKRVEEIIAECLAIK